MGWDSLARSQAKAPGPPWMRVLPRIHSSAAAFLLWWIEGIGGMVGRVDSWDDGFGFVVGRRWVFVALCVYCFAGFVVDV